MQIGPRSVRLPIEGGSPSSAAITCRREFVDLNKLVIHLPKAKTGNRDVPISPNLRQFLTQHLQSIATDCPWLFPSLSSKSGHTEDLAKPWERIINGADLAGRHITRHTLRHTAITHLVQAGVDLPTVQRVSGHKTLQMVCRYSHQNQHHVQDALAKLDGRICPWDVSSIRRGTNPGRLHRNYTSNNFPRGRLLASG